MCIHVYTYVYHVYIHAYIYVHVCFLGWCMIAIFYLKICLMGEVEASFFAALEANTELAGR